MTNPKGRPPVVPQEKLDYISIGFTKANFKYFILVQQTHNLKSFAEAVRAVADEAERQKILLTTGTEATSE